MEHQEQATKSAHCKRDNTILTKSPASDHIQSLQAWDRQKDPVLLAAPGAALEASYQGGRDRDVCSAPRAVSQVAGDKSPQQHQGQPLPADEQQHRGDVMQALIIEDIPVVRAHCRIEYSPELVSLDVSLLSRPACYRASD